VRSRGHQVQSGLESAFSQGDPEVSIYIYSPLTSVQHYSLGFSIKMPEETACAGTHYGNCVHWSDFPRMLQGRVGAHKLGMVGNTIYVDPLCALILL